MIDLKLIQNFLPEIISGVTVTLQITFSALSIGLILGCILGVIQARGHWMLRTLVSIYTTLFRGTPMLVQITFFYYFLPLLGLSFSSMMSAICAIGLNSSAYVSQVIRSGINGVSADEIEAAKVLGFTPLQTARYLILPQAIRNVIPSLTNESITLLKDSSLAATIGVTELYKQLRSLLNQSYDVTTVFFLLFATYLIMTGIISAIGYILEKRLRYDRN